MNAFTALFKILPFIFDVVKETEEIANKTQEDTGQKPEGTDKLAFAKGFLKAVYENIMPNPEIPFEKLEKTVEVVINSIVKYLPKKQ